MKSGNTHQALERISCVRGKPRMDLRHDAACVAGLVAGLVVKIHDEVLDGGLSIPRAKAVVASLQLAQASCFVALAFLADARASVLAGIQAIAMLISDAVEKRCGRSKRTLDAPFFLWASVLAAGALPWAARCAMRENGVASSWRPLAILSAISIVSFPLEAAFVPEEDGASKTFLRATCLAALSCTILAVRIGAAASYRPYEPMLLAFAAYIVAWFVVKKSLRRPGQ